MPRSPKPTRYLAILFGPFTTVNPVISLGQSSWLPQRSSTHFPRASRRHNTPSDAMVNISPFFPCAKATASTASIGRSSRPPIFSRGQCCQSVEVVSDGLKNNPALVASQTPLSSVATALMAGAVAAAAVDPHNRAHVTESAPASPIAVT